MSYRTVEIESVGALLELLPSINLRNQDVWFRGNKKNGVRPKDLSLPNKGAWPTFSHSRFPEKN